jgi:hypothetical protein
MIFIIKQERTYTTYLSVEADSIEEAEAEYLHMVSNGVAYHEELEQMNIDENYEIYKKGKEES